MAVRLNPGCEVRHYRVEALLGQGGEGTVYKARDVRSGECVALKQYHLLASDPAEKIPLERAKRHELLVSLRSPYVVTIRDAFLYSDGFYYVVMEYIEGETVHDLIERLGPLDLEMLRLIVRDTLLGLAALHAREIIHRDIKQENLVFTRRDGSLHVVLLDLGVAHHRKSSRITTKDVPCTLPYAGPEVLLSGDTRPESDLFSLGVVAYEALTKLHPCGRLDPSAEYFELLQKGAFQDVSGLRSDVPKALDAWLRAMLAWNPSDRPRSAEAALDMFERACTGDPFVEAIVSPTPREPVLRPVEEITAVGPRLVVMSGPKAGDFIPVPSHGVCIGRVTLNPEDTRISRIHCRATPVGRGVRLADAGSSNGLVCRERRMRHVTLNPHEEITIGSTVVKFMTDSI